MKIVFFSDEVKAWKSQTSISDPNFEFDPTSFNHMLGSIIDHVDEAGLFDNVQMSNQLIFSSDIVTQSSLEFQEYIFKKSTDMSADVMIHNL